MTKQERIIALFEEPITVAEVAKIVKCRTTRVNQTWATAFGSEAVTARKRAMYAASKIGENNPQFGLRGEGTANFKRGYWIRQTGHRYISAPDWYKGPTHAGYAPEHRIVYCEAVGIDILPSEYDVHHLDCDKLNNEPRNLIALSPRDHQLLHAWMSSLEGVETSRKA